MLSNIIKILIILAMVLTVLFVLGPCVYFNFIQNDSFMPSSSVDFPDLIDATYSFSIENTGGFILSSNYEQIGDVVGSRKYILHGYWEFRGSQFKQMSNDIVLDESIFGIITVAKRK